MVQPDTIVARATPPGMGAVAVVRMSGPEAFAILGELTRRPAEAGSYEPRRATLATLTDPRTGATIDRCLVTVFPRPASYTGEDLVELSTHGGYLVPASVVEACMALGARSAEPGEFTQRAFLNGKIDLTQAEAVADLIGARAPRTAESALNQLDRGLGLRVAELREGLVSLQAHLVQHLDFPEEDEAPLGVGEVAEEARRLASGLAALLETAPSGELLREGALTVLAGPPNSGKSSLFNALLGKERAIVTEEAGTTRDALEATVAVDGFPFRLIDTAGIREGAGRVEQMGIEVARRYLSEADLVLYCRDGEGGPVPGETQFLGTLLCPVLEVATKADLAGGSDSAGGSQGGPEPRLGGLDLPEPATGDRDGGRRVYPVSSLTGSGLPALRQAMVALAFGGLVRHREDVPVLTRRRHTDLVGRALSEVEAFAEALEGGIPAEVASAHLKDAESALEDVLGLITSEDVLDRVFREFCIGK